MAFYKEMNRTALETMAADLRKKYDEAVAKGLKLNLSRGKPARDQLALSDGMFDILRPGDDMLDENGEEIRNYGALEGIPEARRLMAGFLDVEPQEVFIGGSSSLNLMHDCLSFAWIHGLPDSPVPWGKLNQVKFLCPCPGYDRHFGVTEHFGVEMIPIPMTSEGPDMELVEEFVRDPDVRGMWCVPKYSNPEGITYSDATVRAMANLKPAAPDFCIFYDNAYAVHDLYPEEPDHLLPLLTELKKAGRQNMALMFASTSKVTFPGAGISAIGASREMIAWLTRHYTLQTICFDKVNQLRHVRFFHDMDGIRSHMSKHAELLRPKFRTVIDTLERELGDTGVASWHEPRGGYFISLDVLDGCARRTVLLCKEAGVVLTPAGATWPLGRDPQDKNIRIAPTFATLQQTADAAKLLCLCAKLACIEKLLV